MTHLSRMVVGVLAGLMLVGVAPMATAQDELPEDCVAYLEGRDETVKAVNASFGEGLEAALAVLLETRYEYIGMEDVPECATTLHELFLDGLGANQDLLTYYVVFGDESRETVETVISPYLDEINEAIEAELDALGWPHD